MSCKTIKYAAVFVAGTLDLAAWAAIPAASPAQAAPIPPNTAAITEAASAPTRHVYYRRGYHGRGYYGRGDYGRGFNGRPFTAAAMLTPTGPMVILTATPTLSQRLSLPWLWLWVEAGRLVSRACSKPMAS
jgi:hypothetical protein